MANFTREAIKKTFLALLKERPLSDITVKDLVLPAMFMLFDGLICKTTLDMRHVPLNKKNKEVFAHE